MRAILGTLLVFVFVGIGCGEGTTKEVERDPAPERSRREVVSVTGGGATMLSEERQLTIFVGGSSPAGSAEGHHRGDFGPGAVNNQQ